MAANKHLKNSLRGRKGGVWLNVIQEEVVRREEWVAMSFMIVQVSFNKGKGGGGVEGRGRSEGEKELGRTEGKEEKREVEGRGKERLEQRG